MTNLKHLFFPLFFLEMEEPVEEELPPTLSPFPQALSTQHISGSKGVKLIFLMVLFL